MTPYGILELGHTIGSDDGLSTVHCQANTNNCLLLITPLGKNVSQI